MLFATPMHPILAFSWAGRCISRRQCILYLLFLGLEDTFRDSYASSICFFSGLKMHFATPMHPLFVFSRAGRCFSQRLCILHSLFPGLEDTFCDAYASSTRFFLGLKMHFATPMHPLLAFSRAGRYFSQRLCILYSLFLGLEDTFWLQIASPDPENHYRRCFHQKSPGNFTLIGTRIRLQILSANKIPDKYGFNYGFAQRDILPASTNTLKNRGSCNIPEHSSPYVTQPSVSLHTFSV